MLLLAEEKGVDIPCACRPSYFISSLSWHNLSVQESTCPPPASALFSPHQDGRAPIRLWQARAPTSAYAARRSDRLVARAMTIL
jgi:hypothetical protein